MTARNNQSFLDHLRADRRYAAMVGLGFSSGMPFLLVYITQSAWLSEAKVPIQLIGLMSWLTFAYKLKFLWAPLLDQFDAPILSRLLGRRRGWIVASQIGVAVDARRRRFRRSGRAAVVDDTVLGGFGRGRRDPGHCHRRLAHQRGAAGQAAFDGVVFGNGLSRRQSRRRGRRALSRRSFRLACPPICAWRR